MKRIKSIGTLIISVTTLCLIFAVGCGDFADFGATGQTIQSGCKAGSKNQLVGSGGVLASAERNIVTITHMDARYGCDARVEMQAMRLGDQILVYEEVVDEGDSGSCTCAFDLTVPVYDVPDGDYLVRVYDEAEKAVGSDRVQVGDPAAGGGKADDSAQRVPVQEERAAQVPTEEERANRVPHTETRSACSSWRISSMAVEKWANGKVKNAMRAKGNFPINMPGVTERPTWYVNGYNVGKAQIFLVGYMRTVYGGPFLTDGAKNTVTFKFSNPPCAGYSQTFTFDYNASQVPAGGQKWY